MEQNYVAVNLCINRVMGSIIERRRFVFVCAVASDSSATEANILRLARLRWAGPRRSLLVQAGKRGRRVSNRLLTYRHVIRLISRLAQIAKKTYTTASRSEQFFVKIN